MTTTREKLIKARAQLVLSQPFFGTLALGLDLVETDTQETMATDGRTLEYNPAFVDSLPLPVLVGVLAHEVMHPASQHHTRRAGRDPDLWNQAADYAINPLLIEAGFQLPEGALIDSRFKGKSADSIFATLDQERPEQPDDGDDGDQAGQPGTDPGGCGGVMDAPGKDGQAPTESDLAEAEADWKVKAVQAANAAKAAGNMPAGIERMISAIREPKASCREILRRFMDASAKNDYSWSPPNRRYVAMGLYLPSLHSNELGELVVAVDTSGSIDQGALERFAGELSSIFDEVRPSRVHVIYCDRTIHEARTFEGGDEFTLEATGRGGTDLRPPFEWVRDQGLDPAALIYFTDLDGPMPDEAPGYPVLWAAYGTDQAAGFGETVPLDE